MQNFRDLKVWQRAHSFVLHVYEASRGFPREEQFGLTSQLRRAASSIAANIAEGCVRSTDADFARFLSIAIGSASEADYHLLLARDLEMLPSDRYDALNSELQEVKRMLAKFIARIRRDNGFKLSA